MRGPAVRFVFAALLLTLSVACVTGSDISRTPATAAASDGVARTAQLGQLIYVHDMLSGRATNLLLREGVDFAGEGIEGWMVEEAGQGYLVRFVRPGAGGLEAAYDVTFPAPSASPTLTRRVGTALTEPQSRQLAARRLALANLGETCGEAYNPVAFKAPGEDAWLVYLLAATRNPDLVLVGGHYRMTVSGDGRTLLAAEPLFRSCLTLSKKDIPTGSAAAGAGVTYSLSTLPSEIHVFLSLLHALPLYVATKDGAVWYVANGEIERAE